MKYIKKFNTREEYEAAMDSLELPNVSLIVDEMSSVGGIELMPYPDPEPEPMVAIKFRINDDIVEIYDDEITDGVVTYDLLKNKVIELTGKETMSTITSISFYEVREDYGYAFDANAFVADTKTGFENLSTIYLEMPMDRLPDVVNAKDYEIKEWQIKSVVVNDCETRDLLIEQPQWELIPNKIVSNTGDCGK